jgi:molecular chaperone DnaJ
VIKAAEEKFKEAAEAYEVLSRCRQEERYDQYGQQRWEATVVGFSGGGMRMEDIFANFGDIFSEFGGGGSPFDAFFWRRRRRKHPRQRCRGSNLRVTIPLNLSEISKGAHKTIRVKKYITCKTCDGSGRKTNNLFKHALLVKAAV